MAKFTKKCLGRGLISNNAAGCSLKRDPEAGILL